MLKYLTQKLQNQTLSEGSPAVEHDVQECMVEQEDNSPTVENLSTDDPEGENAEICSIIEGGKIDDRNEQNQENQQIVVMSPPQPLMRAPLRPVQPANTPADDTPTESAEDSDGKAASTQEKPGQGGCLDVVGGTSGCHTGDLCACAEAPSGSLVPVVANEGRSSTEELELINCCPQNSSGSGAMKRKWATAIGSSNSSSGSSMSTTDEEVQDLTNAKPLPINFSCSPPQGLPRLIKKVSPHHFMANMAGTGTSPKPIWISPCKRQRRSSFSSDPDFLKNHRPYLDFDKVLKMKIDDNSEAKIVKVKTITANRNSPKCLPDPATYKFQSISTSITPVEEPCAF